ncbi:hypothetical protein [Amycolatopsis magusensis]|uniref:hypothetical protein n=1 Tax=Amycolatopsis magusensis TaxID=882444 RepID=UPI00379CF4C1
MESTKAADRSSRPAAVGAALAEAAKLRGLPATGPAAHVVIDLATYATTAASWAAGEPGDALAVLGQHSAGDQDLAQVVDGLVRQAPVTHLVGQWLVAPTGFVQHRFRG